MRIHLMGFSLCLFASVELSAKLNVKLGIWQWVNTGHGFLEYLIAVVTSPTLICVVLL